MLKSVQELIAETTSDVPVVNAATARQQQVEHGGYLIDVREPSEAQQKPVNGAINIPRGILEMKIGTLCKDPATPIFIHCASGGRARLAAAQLRLMGYFHASAISCDIDTVCRTFNHE